MSKNSFVTEEHQQAKKFFKFFGPFLLVIGIGCLVIAIFEFFTLDFFEEPKLDWLFFVGMPFLFVGFIFTGLGYGSTVAKYQSREMAPIAKDTFNYLAEETTEGFEKIAQAIHTGKSTIIQARSCDHCQHLNPMNANFCNECGKNL
ncbi:zinc ribbon domain-containing protein [Solibacillus sp. FSL R7-0682]|uniref:zinc ribbon domain-containing protein n=1 Tax=Solibacillus sp. FSL R7-0682 TaxID=2921690 RepID=UPI0030F52E3D